MVQCAQAYVESWQVNADYFNRIAAVYGLGVDEFLDLFSAQEHRCIICRKRLVLFSSDRTEAPVVDHCHKTGAVRGILCNACNVAVGFVEKSKNRTDRILWYLRGYRGKKRKVQLPDGFHDWCPKDKAIFLRRYKRDNSTEIEILNKASRGELGKVVDIQRKSMLNACDAQSEQLADPEVASPKKGGGS